jgi:hypothetical protein
MTTTTVEKVGNASEVVRRVIKAHGNKLKAKEIQTLAQQMFPADELPSEAIINNVKFQVRKGKAEGRAKRAARKPVALQVVAAPTPAVDETQQLIAVKKFADGLGGLEKLKGLIPKVEEMIAAFSAAA